MVKKEEEIVEKIMNALVEDELLRYNELRKKLSLHDSVFAKYLKGLVKDKVILKVEIDEIIHYKLDQIVKDAILMTRDLDTKLKEALTKKFNHIKDYLVDMKKFNKNDEEQNKQKIALTVFATRDLPIFYENCLHMIFLATAGILPDFLERRLKKSLELRLQEFGTMAKWLRDNDRRTYGLFIICASERLRLSYLTPSGLIFSGHLP